MGITPPQRKHGDYGVKKPRGETRESSLPAQKKKASGDRVMKDQGATLLPLLHTTLTVRSQLKLSGSSKERNSKAERHCVLSGGKK